ncbi:MAG: branched-chain amino acid ABC transporter permease [Pseudomonadota bacterium]
MSSDQLQFLIQLTVSGITVGSVYSLIALGFVLIYKATDVLNLAVGEMMMLGAYFCFSLVTTFKLPYIPAFLVTLIFSAILGLLLERIILRPMIGEPLLAVVMITIGLGTVFRSLIGMIWGPFNRVYPTFFSEEPIMLGNIVVSQVHLWAMIMAIIVMIIFLSFFKFSSMGIAMRATADDQDIAFLMGISVKKVVAVSWVIAAVISSISGIFLGIINSLNLNLYMIGFKALPAAVMGGLDSLVGALLGGVIVGILENLAGGYLDHIVGGGVKEIAAFVILLLIMMIRPYGLFGTKEIERV